MTKLITILISVLALLMGLASAVSKADVRWQDKTADFVVEFYDTACPSDLAAMIEPTARDDFNGFVFKAISPEALAATGGKAIVRGCYTESDKWVSTGNGMFFFNEHGGVGQVTRAEVERLKKGVQL